MNGSARLRAAQRSVLAASAPGSTESFCGPVLSVLPVEGVAVSLLTRARDLVIGLPALLIWQWLEFQILRHEGRALGSLDDAPSRVGPGG